MTTRVKEVTNMRRAGANVRIVSIKRMRRPKVHGSVASNPEICKLIIGSCVA
jgi:hypothetical protein